VRRTAFILSILAACATAAWAQSEKRPNIALNGCLLSQGYATFIVDNARVDATGDQAATAAPKSASAGARPANEPAKWVLDEPGNIRSHVGEQVQVIGVTDWKRDDPVPTASSAAPTPHVTVITVKFLSPSCS
jgi:hypothetical protein